MAEAVRRGKIPVEGDAYVSFPAGVGGALVFYDDGRKESVKQHLGTEQGKQRTVCGCQPARPALKKKQTFLPGNSFF